MSVIQLSRQAVKGASAVQNIINNPLSIALDALIGFIIKAIIPVPFASELIVYFKGPILALLLGGVLLGVTLIFIIITILFTPFSTMPSLSNILSGAIPAGQNLQQVIHALNGYIEPGFSDANVPNKDPFGGTGNSNMTITVNYQEVESFVFAGEGVTENEQGIDIIPSSNYDVTNKAYKLTGLPIIFDTLTGTTHTYVDQYGANIVEVTNAAQTVKTVYIHLSQVLVGNGVTVHPGQPIGVMGSTGMSTGPHLEYQVRLNQGGSWITQNPINYIN